MREHFPPARPDEPPGEGAERPLCIRYSTRSPSSVVLVMLAGAFIAVAVESLIRSGRDSAVTGPLLLLAAASVGYVALAQLLNETLIEVTQAAITISHRPIPLSQSTRIPADQILQLYVETTLTSARWGPVARLVAVLQDGDRVPLTGYLVGERAQIASTIEKKIERHLQIVNRPIICARCGYDLRATAKRCPECGLPFRSTKRLRRAWRAPRR